MSESLPPAPKDSPRDDDETKPVNPWRKRVSYLLALGLLALFFLPNILNSDDCLLYTSDAADDLTRVDLGGRRII